MTTSKPTGKNIVALERSAEEKMVLSHALEGSSSHMRRTLDQYRFATLDTSARDADQTVQRYARQQTGQQWQNQRMLMVDQLWLWVLDDREFARKAYCSHVALINKIDTVLSCFPPVWKQPSKDPTNVSEAILRYLLDPRKRRWIRNVEELAYCIVDRCASNILDSALMPEQSFDFVEMFRRTIGEVVSNSWDTSLHKL